MQSPSQLRRDQVDAAQEASVRYFRAMGTRIPFFFYSDFTGMPLYVRTSLPCAYMQSSAGESLSERGSTIIFFFILRI